MEMCGDSETQYGELENCIISGPEVKIEHPSTKATMCLFPLVI
jgi:hypothetical protein